MSSSRKKCLRRLKEITKNLEQLKVKQEVKVENNITGLCPVGNSGLKEIDSKIEEISSILTGMSSSLAIMQNELENIKNTLSH